MAMENDPFMDDFPMKTSIYSGFSMAILNNHMVNHEKYDRQNATSPGTQTSSGLSQKIRSSLSWRSEWSNVHGDASGPNMMKSYLSRL